MLGGRSPGLASGGSGSAVDYCVCGYCQKWVAVFRFGHARRVLMLTLLKASTLGRALSLVSRVTSLWYVIGFGPMGTLYYFAYAIRFGDERSMFD